jgi:hypothetical protein
MHLIIFFHFEKKDNLTILQLEKDIEQLQILINDHFHKLKS